MTRISQAVAKSRNSAWVGRTGICISKGAHRKSGCRVQPPADPRYEVMLNPSSSDAKRAHAICADERMPIYEVHPAGSNVKTGGGAESITLSDAKDMAQKSFRARPRNATKVTRITDPTPVT